MAEAIRGPRAIVGIRRRLVAVSVPLWERDYRAYFADLERRIMANLPSVNPGAKAVTPSAVDLAEETALRLLGKSGWEDAESRLRTILNRQYASMTQTVWTDVVGAQVGSKLDFDLNARGVERVLSQVATRVTQINEASQQMIATRVAAEIRSGSNADKLEQSLRGLLRSWGETGGRAHIIALTETGFAYNYAATEGYRESGLVEEVQVYDGPECGWTEHDDPDLADGSTRTLDEANDYPLSHPHCQRAFGPVVTREIEPLAPEGEITTLPPEEVAPPPEAVVEDLSGPTEDIAPPEPVLSQGSPGELPEEVVRHMDDLSTAILRNEPPEAINAGFGNYGLSRADTINLNKGWESLGKSNGMSASEAQAAVVKATQEALDSQLLSTRRSSESLGRILDGGRFKSQFETGKSAGALNPKWRAAAERWQFGYAEDLAVEVRPIYGFMRNGVDDLGQAEWYGDAIMDLAPSVRSRSTVTFTDSLDARAQPSPLNAVKATSFDPWNAFGDLPKKGYTGTPYTEVQMHGGVKASDIVRITFERGEPDDLLKVKLRDAGFHQTTVWPPGLGPRIGPSVWER